MPAPQTEDPEADSACGCGGGYCRACVAAVAALSSRPIEVGDIAASSSSSRGGGEGENNAWLEFPLLGPLLFVNESSDARDHCANERTFLSYVRLSVYMAVVAIAIVLSFHLKTRPTPLERRMALPLGIVFWLLSVSCLVVGFGNYIKTVNKYSRKAAIVQTGWRTQSVSGLFTNYYTHLPETSEIDNVQDHVPHLAGHRRHLRGSTCHDKTPIMNLRAEAIVPLRPSQDLDASEYSSSVELDQSIIFISTAMPPRGSDPETDPGHVVTI
ncbi:hypothetical protein GGR56DRAFT_632687 [Xylariaceae sp. FL0804]|nr:hypothetical protein GGR56DRAFT_632687 [Xylariaceae sp. FL0804]